VAINLFQLNYFEIKLILEGCENTTAENNKHS